MIIFTNFLFEAGQVKRVMFIEQYVMKAQRGSTGIAVLFLKLRCWMKVDG